MNNMSYTNSSLVSYTKISPMKNSGRKHPTYNPSGVIDKITIHHMAGNLSVETCGNLFQTREASANYGIGSDGRIALYVDEKDRSWASSSPSNDYRAVTIEVANNTGSPKWTISDEAYASLIKLVVDICKRNNIKQLNYTGDASGNLTMHCFFAATACPGAYLKSKYPDIVNKVNSQLTNSTTSTSKTKKVLVEDGIWGVNTTKYTQKLLGTIVDGIVSSQRTSCKKYLPSAHTGSWEFKMFGVGSIMIEALQKYVGLSGSNVDGLAGKITVTSLQKFLDAKGFNTGAIDGIMGTLTVTAWQKYLNSKF